MLKSDFGLGVEACSHEPTSHGLLRKGPLTLPRPQKLVSLQVQLGLVRGRDSDVSVISQELSVSDPR